MTYPQTLDWLFSQLPMYQRTGGANYKIDLEKTWALMELLDHPERKIKAVHIGGTNGKGSTSHMIASVLQQAGYKTGLYTSPHLIDFRERVRINGTQIPEEDVINFVNTYKDDFEHLQLSFFEMTVGLAFHYFVKQNVDIAVVEVGMGGRLDSTNVLTPLVSVITNIGLDHQQFLGNTLQKIATEKAGIIKPYIPVVIGETQQEIQTIFLEKASKENAPIAFADKQILQAVETDLKGWYQQKNIKTALLAIRQLETNGFNISPQDLLEGFKHIKKNTGFLGRWQVIQENPKVVCDTGHNKEGIREVVAQLKAEKYNTLHIIWGMINDKNPEQYLELLPRDTKYYFTQPSIPRKLPLENLEEAAKKTGLIGKGFKTVNTAYKTALANASIDDLVYVGGSTFVVADFLEYLNNGA